MKKISRKLLGVVLFLAAPMCLTSCFGDSSGSSNSGSSNNNNSGSGERVYLTSVSISANRTSFLTGENIVITPSITPYNANYYDDSYYKESFFEHFYEKDGGEAVQFKKNSFAGSFTFEEPGNYVFWSKYCNHNFHSGTSGDLVSNRIEVSVDLPESEKVLFKYDTLPDGTLSIYAGKLLYKESDVVIPATIDGKKVSKIKDSGFIELPSIRTLKFDSALQDRFEIGTEAFKNCPNLAIVELPWQVKTIGKRCFNNSNIIFLVEEQTIPSGFAENGYSYAWNSKLGTVYCNIKDFIEENNFLFGLNPLNGYEVIQYSGRGPIVEIPQKVEELDVVRIRGSAFLGNNAITKVVIPETVVEIYNNVFENCTLLSDINIPENCTSIGEEAFLGCSQLKYVSLPYSVVEVGKKCFKNCHPDLILLCAQAVRPSGYAENGYSYAWNCGAKRTYFNKLGFIHDGDFSYGIIGDNSGLSVVEYRGRNSNLVIPNEVNSYTVKEIGYECFKDMNFIVNLTLPENTTTIEKYAFSGCISLQKVVLTSALKTIETYGFSGCTSLTSIVIPEGVETIESRAFYNCTNLEIYVEATVRPNGFYTSYTSSTNWNANTKMTYYGKGNGWFVDPEGNPYHL